MNYKKIVSIATLASVIAGNCGHIVTHASENETQVIAQATSGAESAVKAKIDQLFKDGTYTKLVEGITQSKIDQVKNEVEALTDSDQKESFRLLVEKATNLLQEFNFLGLGNWTFASVYYHADGSNYAQLKINAGTPHSYIANNYLTIKVKNTSDEVVYNKEMAGNVWNAAATENIPLQEGYTLEIVKQEAWRFSTNNNNELKQDEASLYTYKVRNGRLVRINDINRTIKFLGLGNAQYASLNIDYYTKKVTISTNKVKPHVYFSGSYQKIEILDSNDNVVYSKDFIGNIALDGSSESIPFEVGYKIKLTGAEQHTRAIAYNDKNVQDSKMSFEKSESILLIENAGIELPGTILAKLYKDSSYTTLVDDLTQAKIDAVRVEVEALPEYSGKSNKISLVDKAEDSLQQFSFLGLSDWVFAQLFYHADGSNYAQLKINAGTPHSYVSSNYLTITAKDTSGEVVYSKALVGNQKNAAATENIPLKEGYILEVVKQEPHRYSTNHNDELKQNESNPYIYMVKNNKLERINDINRTFKFLGLGNTHYATLKVDYNSKKMTLSTNAVTPHSYFSSSYQKIEVLDSKGKVVYTKDFVGNVKLSATSESIPFEVGYKIKLTGAEQHTRCAVYDDKNNVDSDISIRKSESVLLVQNSGITNKFVIEDSMKQTYIDNFNKRIGKENIQEFIKIDESHNEFIQWIYSTPEAMKLYLSGGYASPSKQGDMVSYQYRNTYNSANELKALNVWYDIWSNYDNSTDGINLKIAIATSLEFANGVSTWLTGATIDPLTRYENFASAEAENILMADFVNLEIQEMRNVVNAKIADDEMEWLREYVSTNHSSMITRDQIVRGYALISYNMTNPETGESVFGSNFYGPNPTIREVIRYGGVCGAMSKLSSVLAQAYGVPAFPIGQPGHCAYEYLGSDHEYKLGYDVSGWSGSANYNTTLPYILLYNEFYKNTENYEESEYYKYRALVATDDVTAIENLDKAIEIEPLNYSAWEEKIKIVARTASSEEFESLLQEVRETFKDYGVIKENLTQDNVKNSVYTLFVDEECTQLSDSATITKINSLRASIDKLPEGAYKDKYIAVLDKASELIQEFRLLGLSNRNFASLVYYADGSNYTKLTINAGQPHSYFKDAYVTIQVKDTDGNVVYTKVFDGDTSYAASTENIELQEGYTLEFILQETGRFNTSNDAELKQNLANKTYSYEVVNNKLTSKAVN